MPFDPALRAAADTTSAWPFEEARKLVERVKKTGQTQVLFETGYGPSGLPHIGTFGEVARTTMVRKAFELLTDGRVKTRLIAFSDDMDGLRKVPDNVPNKAMLASHLGKPLSDIPDPFSNQFPSFGAHNNARLRAFLDTFGFEYEFKSSTECYRSGMFDATLLLFLRRLEEVQKIMLPSLREERAATYSPFLPIHPETRVVMQVPTEARPDAGTVVWTDPDTGKAYETPVTGGHCKLQWKPDWAMRWMALGVDYEMAGKDLIDSVRLSSAIVRRLGGAPPEGFNYELFLDEGGQKISKSKGNGLTIDEWLTYASPESLALFMYSKPREAKRLHFDVIPRAVDEYLSFLDAYGRQDEKNRLGNPVFHIHGGTPPAPEKLSEGEGRGSGVTFGLLLNLVAVANAESKDVLWGFLKRYAPGLSPQTHPRLDALVGYAIRYFADFVKPKKTYRAPDDVEAAALMALSEALGKLPATATPDEIQNTVYDIARAIPRFQDPRAKGATPERPGVSNLWFNTLYQLLLGEEKGPRFGSFAAIYGLENTRALIGKALSGALLAEHDAFLKGRAA